MEEPRGFWKPISHKKATLGFEYGTPKYSPDGKKLAYIIKSERTTALMVMNTETGISYQITTEHKISTGTAYGGGVYCWSSDSQSIIFSSNGVLFKAPTEGGDIHKLPSMDLSFNPFEQRGKILFSVEHEDHMSIGILDEEWPRRLPIDGDFLYDAVMSPVNDDIALHQWNFPNMSWDSSRIILFRNKEVIVIADGRDESVCQPRFSPDGKHIAYISDKNGWWNLWIADADGNSSKQLVNAEEEHSYSTWVTGASNYQWSADSETIIFTHNRKGKFGLSKVNINTGEIVDLDCEGGYYQNLSINHRTNELAFDFTNHRTRNEIRTLDIETGVVRTVFATGLRFSDEELAKMVEPRYLDYPTRDGSQAHGLLYALPDKDGNVKNCPTIFLIHGGPTGMSRDSFRIEINYWVSMGWAVFAVNHRGSAGYGRQFRQKLNGNWGIYDVSDTIDARKHLISSGITDEKRTVVMGGSAGGYTTLMCMAKHPGTFTAGVNLFGVSDLFGLSEETHYLESQYDTMLVGKLPEDAQKFFERSPIYLADRITDPLLILQGADDPVVPQNQSDRIASLVKGEVEYKIYDGEGHGFRKFSTIEDMMNRIEKFLKRFVLY